MLSVGLDLLGRERYAREEKRRGEEMGRAVRRNTCCCFWAQISPSSPSSPPDVSTRSSGTGTSKGGRRRNLVVLDVIGARRVADGAWAAVRDGS